MDKIGKVQLGLSGFKSTLHLYSYMFSTTICVNSVIYHNIYINQSIIKNIFLCAL